MSVAPAGLLERLELVNVGPAERMGVRLAPRLNLFTGDNGLSDKNGSTRCPKTTGIG